MTASSCREVVSVGSRRVSWAAARPDHEGAPCGSPWLGLVHVLWQSRLQNRLRLVLDRSTCRDSLT